jgi:hypothetical protein
VRVTGAAGLLALCFVVGGCGSSESPRLSHDEYLQRIREITSDQAAGTASRLFIKLVVEPGLPASTCGSTARLFHSNVDEVISEVAALSPPNDVANLQRRFISAARESSDLVGRAAADATAGRLRCGPPMNRRIYGLPSTDRIDRMLIELREKGYIIGLNSQD